MAETESNRRPSASRDIGSARRFGAAQARSVITPKPVCVRMFGGSFGFAQDFRGPFAKQQRLAVLTVACLAGAVEVFWHHERDALFVAAILIAIGSALTCVTRTGAITRQLRMAI